MRIALTCNGPGELAGWARPLLRALYARDPNLEVHLFFVPDDYATGRETEVARELFPSAKVYAPREYLRVAFGRSVAGLPEKVDVVQYLGGDLMHAARIHKRLGGTGATYKFSRARYRSTFAAGFAVDEANAAELIAAGIPARAVAVSGNLAIDGALLESRNPLEAGAPRDGILIMPGSRRHEIEQLIPFFFTAALAMRERSRDLPIAFGLSPFTSLVAVRAAIEAGGHPRMYAQRGRLLIENDQAFLATPNGELRFPILRNALSAANVARLVLTIPGTKAIELAALGKPFVACTPMNTPEFIAINGPLTYLNRVPLVGTPLKRAAVVAVSRRFKYHTQPNIDADAMIALELHGTLMPGHVAAVALERFSDEPWIRQTGARLKELYRGHVGAAERMAGALEELAHP
ncbi:MAG: hypothetical protein M3Y21_12305 [Candidatus Eremiobacteraeota bacterium]|nr:hypothetical protein [Candidatus Eremiobacteraeota bacterium]